MVIGVGAVQAGGTRFEPSDVRIEAGEHIELTATVARGALGWVEDGPFFVYLQGDEFGSVVTEGYGGTATDVLLGELDVGDRAQRLDVSAGITIPDETPPGEYWISVCNDPCTTGLGDLVGATIYVDLDPPVVEEVTALVAEPATPLVEDTEISPTTRAPENHNFSRRLALAPYTNRPADLSPIWIGFSAALAGAVLLTALLSRQRY